MPEVHHGNGRNKACEEPSDILISHGTFTVFNLHGVFVCGHSFLPVCNSYLLCHESLSGSDLWLGQNEIAAISNA